VRPDPAALPRPIRMALFGLAVAVLLFLCLAPTDDLPKEHLWDKAEHAIAWFVLAGLGLALSPKQPLRIALFAIGLGAAVEILQATMGFGRDGDWRDLVADSLGVGAALLVRAVFRRHLGKIALREGAGQSAAADL
jgi:VanZ family protein